MAVDDHDVLDPRKQHPAVDKWSLADAIDDARSKLVRNGPRVGSWRGGEGGEGRMYSIPSEEGGA